MSSQIKDTIYLRNLELSAIVGPDAWGRVNKTQPVVLSLRLCRDTLRAGISDEINDTFSYGQMCKEVTALIEGKSFPDLASLSIAVQNAAITWAGESLHCQVTLPKGLLRVEGGLGSEFVMHRHPSNEWSVFSSQWNLKNIKTACIIGVNAHERLEKQAVNIHLCVPAGKRGEDTYWHPSQGNETWRRIVRKTLVVSDLRLLDALLVNVLKAYR